MAILGGQRGAGSFAFLLQLRFVLQLSCMAARAALNTKNSPKPAWLGLSSQRSLLPAALPRAAPERAVGAAWGSLCALTVAWGISFGQVQPWCSRVSGCGCVPDAGV